MMASATTQLRLILKNLNMDIPPTIEKTMKGIKAGNRANESRNSPCNRHINDRCAPQPGHSTPKYCFEKQVIMTANIFVV